MEVNKIGIIMRELHKISGFSDCKYTNHSLRPYMVTTLGGGVNNSEAIVQRSCHRSSSDLQEYV